MSDKIFVPVYEWDFAGGLQGWIETRVEGEQLEECIRFVDRKSVV